MTRVGLTGGIGSGKSIICNIFRQLNVPVYHADIRAKILSDNDPELIQSLVHLFGKTIYTLFGLDRKKLAGIIFNDKVALQKVNDLIHPKVIHDYKEWLRGHEHMKYTIHEAAILFESGMGPLFDKTVMVTAPEALRIKRVMKRDDVDENHVRKIMNSQMPEEKKTELSDYIITNDDKTPVLPQIIKIHESLSSL
ncbi:MAG: dephospho-CoA kinase [Bacteroidales bacterium]|nr:dephospho-CoA kinase [Bacteroidales bacterium]